MSLFSELKRSSKRALNDHWGSAIVISLIPLFVIFLLSAFHFISLRIVGDAFFSGPIVFDFSSINALTQSMLPYRQGMIAHGVVSFVFAIMSILVVSPLILSSVYWHYKLVKGEAQSFREFFHFFESFRLYRRSLGFQINLGIRKFFWSVIFLALPTALLSTTGYLFAFRVLSDGLTPRGSSFWIMGISLLSILYLLVSVFFTAYMNKYFLAPYLFVDDEMTSTGQSIKKSINYTKGYRFNIIAFVLSFFGWFILMIFLPTIIYSLPYIQTSLAMYAHYLIETKKREQPTLGEKPAPENKSLKPTLISPPTGQDTATTGFPPSYQQDITSFSPPVVEQAETMDDPKHPSDNSYPGL